MGLEGLSYERLNRLCLFSLERRRLRINLSEDYKILWCIDKVDGLFPIIGETKTRVHRFKVRGKMIKWDMRSNLFTQYGNELPEEVVEVGKITKFK